MNKLKIHYQKYIRQLEDYKKDNLKLKSNVKKNLLYVTGVYCVQKSIGFGTFKNI